MKDDIPACTSLRQGQSYTAFVEAGTHVVALQGAIRLAPAYNTSGGAFSLQEGQAWLVESAGWLRIDAPSGGRFLLAQSSQEKSSWARCLVQAVRSIPGLLRHALQAQ